MTNSNDPVSPIKWEEYREARPNLLHVEVGLTKREYFAAMAMQGIHAMYAHPDVDITTYSQKTCAGQAVIAADALIAELNK